MQFLSGFFAGGFITMVFMCILFLSNKNDKDNGE